MAMDVGEDWGIWAPSATPLLRSSTSHGDIQLGSSPDVPSCPLWLLTRGPQLQGPRAPLLWEIHPSLALQVRAGLGSRAQVQSTAGVRAGKEGTAPAWRESRELIPRVHKGSQLLAPVLRSQRSRLARCLGRDLTPEAPMEWPRTWRGWNVPIRAGVCSDRPWVTPSPPQDSPDQPLGAQLLCSAELGLLAWVPREKQEFWALAQPRVDETAHFSFSSSFSSPSIITALLDCLHPCSVAGTLWRAEH